MLFTEFTLFSGGAIKHSAVCQTVVWNREPNTFWKPPQIMYLKERKYLKQSVVSDNRMSLPMTESGDGHGQPWTPQAIGGTVKAVVFEGFVQSFNKRLLTVFCFVLFCFSARG